MAKTKVKTSNNDNAVEMQEIIISTSQEINNALTTSGNVRSVFHAHYINLATGEHGIENLITDILAAAGAVFPENVCHTQFKKLAVATSLFASDIFTQVQERFTAGSVRYPDSTIYQYLSVFMSRQRKIGKIKLTGAEDTNRSCCKPRTKYFLIQ